MKIEKVMIFSKILVFVKNVLYARENHPGYFSWVSGTGNVLKNRGKDGKCGLLNGFSNL